MKTISYFLSYSRQNSRFVCQLATDLKKAGTTVWLDQADIAPGSRWDDSIAEALGASEGLIVFLSQASVRSQNVMDEVSYAIDKGKRIVPVKIEDCTVPFRLARFQHIDFMHNYDTALQKLLSTLKDDKTLPQNTTPEKKMPDGSSLLKNTQLSSKKMSATKVTGVLFVFLAVFMAIIGKCPSNVQYFIIYALIGIGIALIFAKSADRTAANLTIRNVGMVLGGGVALPFILFFANPIGSFKPDGCPLLTTSATVFVHGKKGKQDMILRQKGYVIMDVGGERKKVSINENGQTFFQNLQVGDSVRLEIDFSEPYKTIYPDSIYVIEPNSKIYLPIALQGINIVKGRVFYNDAPLPGVRIEIDTLSTTSNETGQFSINIPELLQRDRYEVWFIKQGFKTRSAPATPQIGEPLEIVMEK